MSKIFLSYSDKDLRKVEQIHETIDALGYDVWMFTRNIEIGLIDHQIRRKLEDTDLCICFLSNEYFSKMHHNGTGLYKEVQLIFEFVKNRNMLLLPVKLEEIEYLQNFQEYRAINCFDTKDVSSLRELFEAINKSSKLISKEISNSMLLSIQYKEKGRDAIREWGKSNAEGNWNWRPLGLALECFLESIRFEPRHQYAWTNLAYTYHIIGKKDSALKCLEISEALAEEGPNKPGAHWKAIKQAIENDSTQGGTKLKIPAMSHWFEKKYNDYFAIDNEVHTSFRDIIYYINTFLPE